MVESRKKWIIKNVDGLVLGPYTTEQILNKIRSGDFMGEESIALYPGSQWRPISQDPQFYDSLLEALSGHVAVDVSEDTFDPSQHTKKSRVDPVDEPVPRGKSSSSSHESIEIETDEDSDDDDAFTLSRTSPLDPIAEAETGTGTGAGSETRTGSGTASSSGKSSRARKKSKKFKAPKLNVFKDIELVDVKKRLKLELAKRARLPLFVLGLVFLAAVFLLSQEDVKEERIRLLSPQIKATANMAPKTALAKLKRAYAYFYRDTYTSYLSAQNELIQTIEGFPKEPRSMSLLCMTYFELWPYAYQDSQDFATVNKMLQLSSKLDPAGIFSSTCRVVDLFVRGRLAEAKNLVESVLEAEAAQGRAPLDFYYLKAVLLAQSKEYLTAIGYLQSAQKLEPQRFRVFVYEAELHMKRGDYVTAAKLLRTVLSAHKNHSMAQILIGIIEVRQFRHFETAQTFLTSGLNGDSVPKQLASEGYFALAEIAIQNNDSDGALEYAQKAYSSNSGNEAAKNLILKLGGVEKLKRTKLKGQQLIFEGDQFVREGDCNTAQAHFKAAYELDKSAVAAMKAGKCLWRLSFSTEATEWLQLAIKADDKLIEAYVILADYHTQRYNFSAAAQTLALAQKVSPKSYEIYRGFALVELRRNSPKTALTYGKKALALYETDVETHIIMAEAYMILNDYRQGYAHGAKAIEIDANNRKAQIVYGQALGGIQGIETGLSHMMNLVQTYPLVTEYRMALGKMYAQDERYNQAEEIFLQVIQIEEKPKEAYLELGKVLRKLDNFQPALDAFLKAAALDPADAEPLFQSGMLHLQIKKPTDAMMQFQRVLRINQRYPLVHYWLGKAALENGDPNEALNQSTEERKINPNMADAYLLAAEAYTKLNQYSLCAQEYQKAIKLRPQGANIYVNLARCYRLAGNLDVAEAMLNHASTQESGFAPIYREQGEVYERRGDFERAIEAYNQYFVLNPNAPDREQIEQRIGNMGR